MKDTKELPSEWYVTATLIFVFLGGGFMIAMSENIIPWSVWWLVLASLPLTCLFILDSQQSND